MKTPLLPPNSIKVILHSLLIVTTFLVCVLTSNSSHAQLSCQSFILDLNQRPDGIISVADINLNSTHQDLRVSRNQFTCAERGVHPIYLIGTDSLGNIDSCLAQVRVVGAQLNMLATSGEDNLILSNVVFENDFEDPFTTNFRNCSPDFAQNLVSELFGDIFDQEWTVETMQINGPAGQYSDPQGIGGDYCLGMLGRIQDDKIAFTINRKQLDIINLRLDVSAIDVPRCGGPFGVDVPKFNFKLYDTPSGVWDFNNRGALLDEKEAEGNSPGSSPYTFNWAELNLQFDAAAATSNHVTILIDQIFQSGYAALDNFIISSSTDSNKFNNELRVLEGNTARITGVVNKAALNNASISSDFGTASLDVSNGTWSWEYDSKDGPDESTQVTVSIQSDCGSESFVFDLIVENVAPSISVVNQSADCDSLYMNGSFSDPGEDVVSILVSEGIVRYQEAQNGGWIWSAADIPSDSVTFIAYDSDGDSSKYTFALPVFNPDALQLSANITSGCAENSGAIVLDISGGCAPYRVAWSDGESGKDRSNLATGAYVLRILDASGQELDTSFTITTGSPFELESSADASVYLGYEPQECAQLWVKPLGGIAPYTYEWSNGATTAEINACPSEASSYTVKVTDALGCSAESKIKVCVNDVRVSHRGRIIPGKVYMTYKYTRRNRRGRTRTYSRTIIVRESQVAHYLSKGSTLGKKGMELCDPSDVVDEDDDENDNPTTEPEASLNYSCAYPNPFRDRFMLAISVKESGSASIEIYNMRSGLVSKQDVELSSNCKNYFVLGEDLGGNEYYIVKIVTQEKVLHHRMYKYGDSCRSHRRR